MYRIVFSAETALSVIKSVYAWMAENQVLAGGVLDIVINRQQKGWEAVVYMSVVAKG